MQQHSHVPHVDLLDGVPSFWPTATLPNDIQTDAAPHSHVAQVDLLDGVPRLRPHLQVRVLAACRQQQWGNDT